MVTRIVPAACLAISFATAAGAEELPIPPALRGMLEVAERVWDAGKVTRGVTLRHQFVLRNVGTAELSIDAKPG